MTSDDGACLNPASFADHRTCFNNRCRTHLHIGGKLGSGIDDRRGMDEKHQRIMMDEGLFMKDETSGWEAARTTTTKL
jgi:hypothetical protein